MDGQQLPSFKYVDYVYSLLYTLQMHAQATGQASCPYLYFEENQHRSACLQYSERLSRVFILIFC